MTSRLFDRIVRALISRMSRRRVLVAIGSLFPVLPQIGRAQWRGPTCSREGEVCTPLVGCCAEMLCATSMINVNYGICIPGEGEMLPVTRALVIPGDEQMVNALLEAALEREAEAELATDRRGRRRQRKRGTKRTTRTGTTPTPTPTP